MGIIMRTMVNVFCGIFLTIFGVIAPKGFQRRVAEIHSAGSDKQPEWNYYNDEDTAFQFGSTEYDESDLEDGIVYVEGGENLKTDNYGCQFEKCAWVQDEYGRYMLLPESLINPYRHHRIYK